LNKGNILISDTNYIWRLHQQNVTKDIQYAHNLEKKEKNKGLATLISFSPQCTQTTIKDNTCNTKKVSKSNTTKKGRSYVFTLKKSNLSKQFLQYCQTINKGWILGFQPKSHDLTLKEHHQK
jgi:hypothetical protein